MSESPDRPETLTIAFKTPIDGPAGPVASIDLREPTAGEMMQWDALNGTAADAMAVSIVAGVPKSVVEKIPAREFIRASRYIASFLE